MPAFFSRTEFDSKVASRAVQVPTSGARSGLLCRQQKMHCALTAVRALRGKTREEIEAALEGSSRSELIDVIFSVATVEQLFKPNENAARSCLNKRAVLRDIRDGKFGDYFCRAENSIIVPASGVNAWLRRFTVIPTEGRA